MSEALAALTYDVLMRQAEGRVWVAGRPYLEARAADHGVTRDSAETERGNLLEILERGVESESERDVVAALAVTGFGEKEPDDDAAFARHGEWLERERGIRVFGQVEKVLPAARAAAVWAELERQCLAETAQSPGARARNTTRLSALASASAGEEALGRIAGAHPDPVVGAVCLALGAADSGAAGPAGTLISGRVIPAPGRRGRVLRWVTGYALIAGLVRGVGALLGYRVDGTLSLTPGAVRLHRETWVLGRKIRSRDETYTLAALARVERHVRFPLFPTAAGVLGLTIGLLLGGFLAIDGVRSGETVLLMMAALVIFLGTGLDFALELLWPGTRGRVWVDLGVLPHRELRLADVPEDEAERFVGALRQRVAGRRPA